MGKLSRINWWNLFSTKIHERGTIRLTNKLILNINFPKWNLGTLEVFERNKNNNKICGEIRQNEINI